MYTFLANALELVHLAYVSTVVVGTLLILFGILFKWQWIRNSWFRGIHLGMIMIVAFETYFGVHCPLTTWERNLRIAAGQPYSESSFVGQIVDWIMFREPGSESMLIVAYYTIAVLIVATFFIAPPRTWTRSPWFANLRMRGLHFLVLFGLLLIEALIGRYFYKDDGSWHAGTVWYSIGSAVAASAFFIAPPWFGRPRPLGDPSATGDQAGGNPA